MRLSRTWYTIQIALVFLSVLPCVASGAERALGLEDYFRVESIGSPAISPDGRWVTYDSDETGRYEVYVQPFPGPGTKRQISAEGGTFPVWARRPCGP